MFELLLFLVITFLLITFFSIRGVVKEQRRCGLGLLEPKFFLLFSFVVYTMAMPISRIVFGTPMESIDNEFMLMNIIALLGLWCGLCFARRKRDYSNRFVNILSMQGNDFSITQGKVAFLSLAGLFFFLLGRLKMLDFNISYVFSAYGFESRLAGSSESLGLILVLSLGTCLSIYAFYVALCGNSKKLIGFTMFILTMMSLFLIIRGGRNVALMLILPAVCLLFTKKVKFFHFILFFIISFGLLHSVAIVRQQGFENYNVLNVYVEDYDPIQTEFGTSYSVYRKMESIYLDKFYYGRTYIIDSFLNLIPKSIWPNRPPTVAQQFSALYLYEDARQLSEGLGFSSLAEGILNFGRWFVGGVFFVFAFVLSRFSDWLREKGAWGILCYYSLPAMLINWNRIDFATCLKMYSIPVFFYFLINWFVRRYFVNQVQR